MLTVTEAAQAGEFDCREVDQRAPGHHHVAQALTDQVGIEPVELRYCEHDSHPRWIARWQPFEELDYDGEVWRRYATARCMDRVDDFHCIVTNHVVAGNSHVVVDIKRCDVPMPTVARIHEAAARLYPGYEIKEIEYVVVLDGGAWTAGEYGYKVWLIEPPEYTGGPILQFVESCRDGTCAWRNDGREGSWYAGSADLAGLRRARNDPLIAYLAP